LGRTCITYEGEKYIQFFIGKPEGKRLDGEPADGSVVLKRISEKYRVRVRTGFVRSGLGIKGGPL
jgi:hypothetical protein